MNTLQKFEPNRPLAKQLPHEVEQLVDKLFEQMFGANPNLRSRFSHEQELIATKRQWVLGFAENGVNTIEQVRAGMKQFRAKADPWFPSVGEFISWCRANEYHLYGLPTPEETPARLAAFKARWYREIRYRSNAEYWLLSGLERNQREGFWTTKELEKAINTALSSMLAELKRGKQYGPPEQKELSAKSTVLSEEQIQRRNAILQQTLAKLRGKTA